MSEKDITRSILGELNGSFSEKYGHTFSTAIVKYCGRSENIQTRMSQVEKKRKVKLQRAFRDQVNSHFRENAALSFLCENESMKCYRRKHLTQSFEKV